MSAKGAIDEILVDHLPGETRAALIERGRLVELLLLRPERESRVGAVIRGRVTALRRDQGAAFVEIGADKAGFLSLRRGARPPHEGEAVIVQVTKDAAGDKGAGLTDRPLVVGRYLTLRPGQPGLERARRLDPERFESAATGLAGIDTATDGFMLQPSAADATPAAMAAEAKALIESWRQAAARGGGAPATLVPAPDPVLRAVLAHAGTLESVRCDDADLMNRLRAEIRRLAPELESLVRRHDGGALLARHEVEDQIDAALARHVRLKRGGELVVDELEAMAVIDVDMAGQQSGGAEADAALAVNLEAADEIARQLRLRDIGGIVVVDFLRLAAPPRRKRVVEALRRATAGDPQQVDVLGMTPAGLVELTRRRGRPSLAQLMAEPCAACAGGGRMRSASTTGFALLRAALRQAGSAPARRFSARAAPAVIAALQAERASLEWTRRRLGATLDLVADASMAPDRYDIVPE
ncbi:MAG: ribonuclease E/G [Alphaproteobacteria bacterium]|nr:ribonuclease E/G [Alphaproteobacteria bacterium]